MIIKINRSVSILKVTKDIVKYYTKLGLNLLNNKNVNNIISVSCSYIFNKLNKIILISENNGL